MLRSVAEYVRPQLIPSHATVGCEFNRPAMLGRYDAVRLVEPVPDVGLLHIAADTARELGLPFANFHGTFECIHGSGQYKSPCKKSTSAFVATRDKELCTVRPVATTFQERMRVAIKRAGGQSALARRLNEVYNAGVSPQTIQYLASTTLEKPAQGSRLTPQIAALTGLAADWLATGTGEQNAEGARDGRRQRRQSITRAGIIEITIKETGEMRRIELTQDAIEVALMFMDLDKRERATFKRQLTVAAMQHMDVRPDAELAHLAAPDTPTARARQKKPSRHSS